MASIDPIINEILNDCLLTPCSFADLKQTLLFVDIE
jgi:hypothetical protein